MQVNRSPDTFLNSDDAARLAGLSVRAIRHNCLAGKYQGATKGEGGWIIPLVSLPANAQTRYHEEQSRAQPNASIVGLPAAISETISAPLDRDALFEALHRAPPGSQSRAKVMCTALVEFDECRSVGATKGAAAAYVKLKHGIDAVTLWRARETVKGHPRELWEAPAITPLPRTHQRGRINA